jgi:ribosomal protein S18 acetylase RimI-like enzyme
MSEIRITTPEEKDLYGIREVFYKTWLDVYPNKEVGITKEDIEDKFKGTFTEERLKKDKEVFLNPSNTDRHIIIAKEGEKVVGVCRVFKKEKFDQLQSIYVLPEYQGKGIGYLLWRKASEFFDPHKDIIVEVATYNKKAICFYEKLGFVDTGERFSEERFRMKSGSMIPEMRMIIKKQRAL